MQAAHYFLRTVSGLAAKPINRPCLREEENMAEREADLGLPVLQGTTAEQSRTNKHAKDQAAARQYLRSMVGPDKAAVIMIAVGEDRAGKLFSRMDDEEIKEISKSMSRLGSIGAVVVEELLQEFAGAFAGGGALVGSYAGTERLLSKFIDPNRLGDIMEDIRGPAGRTIWEKLANVSEQTLATYLKNEYPQTIALVMSKIRSEHAAKVLGELPEELSAEVVIRMLTVDAIKKDVLVQVEETLRTEFMQTLGRTSKRDSHEMMAEIFNSFDRSKESFFMGALDQQRPDSAQKIRSLMFTFEDLARLDPAGVQIVLRTVDKDILAKALKGASDSLKNLFLTNMSERAGKILREDMEAMGPMRRRDVEDAQDRIVLLTKELADKGDVTISDPDGDEELVF